MISLETDEDDIKITKSKHLSNLFDDDDPISVEGSKASLFYKPKQNKKPEAIESKPSPSGKSSSNAPKIFIASAVDVYKLENGKYNYLGKFGMVILGNDLDMTYRVLIYTGKQTAIASATINDKFKFLCQPNNYCTFYDDHRVNWSILFPTTGDLHNFCRNLAHAIYAANYKVNGGDVPTVIQHLGPSKSSNAKFFEESKDQVRMKYKIQAWCFEMNRSLIEGGARVVQSETEVTVTNTELSLEGKKIFGSLEPGDRCYCLMAPNKVGQFSQLLPFDVGKLKKEAKLWKFAFEVELCGFEAKTPVLSHQEEAIEEAQEVEEEAKPVASVEKESKTIKEDLANRMSRMGALPILPIAKPRSASAKSKEDTKPPVDEVSDQSILTRTSSETNHIPPSSSIDLSPFEDKFNQILRNIDEVKQMMREKKPSFLDSSLTMDSAILLSSIQKLIDENNQLKAELSDRKSEIAEINTKLLQVVQESKQSADSDTVLKLKNDIFELKDKIGELKEENYKLSMDKLQLEKERLLEQSVNSKNTARQWRSQLKQVLTSIYTEFNQQLETISPTMEESSRNLMDELLTSVLKSTRARFAKLDFDLDESGTRDHSRSESEPSSIAQDLEVSVGENEENL